MRFSINKKNKKLNKKVDDSLGSKKGFELNVVENTKYINEPYEDMFNLQLMESCISIDEEYNLLECSDDFKVNLYTI